MQSNTQNKDANPNKDNEFLSKALSHALRHEPWLYELELADDGSAPVEHVIGALKDENSRWRDLTEQDIRRMIALSEKKRHELANGRIRALYGHSLPGKFARTIAPPPDWLFHGTSAAAWDVIRKDGLRPMQRQYVHLSVDVDTADKVGRRKSLVPIVLKVLAREASDARVVFYRGNDIVWLADYVPREFLELS